MEQDPSKEPDVHPAWPDTGASGLVELVSSDDVSFFVPRLLLQAHCPVLREMFEIPQAANFLPAPPSPPRRSSCHKSPADMAQPAPPHPRHVPIPLTHDFYELASTLAFFLAIISGETRGRLLEKVPRYQIRNFHATILLAKKWESAMVVHTLEAWLCRLALDRWDNEQWKPSDIFILAAKCDMPHVARMVLETWTQVKKDSPLWNASKHNKASIDAHWSVGVSAEVSTLSPKNWTVQLWQEIGMDYIFALVKSAQEKQVDLRGIVFLKALGKYPEMAKSKQPEVPPKLTCDVYPSWPRTAATALVEWKSSDNISFFVPYALLAGQSERLYCLLEESPRAPDDSTQGSHPIYQLSSEGKTTPAASFAFLIRILEGRSLQEVFDEFPRHQVENCYEAVMLAHDWACPCAVSTIEAFMFRVALDKWENPHWKFLDVLLVAAPEASSMDQVAQLVVEQHRTITKASSGWDAAKHEEEPLDNFFESSIYPSASIPLDPLQWDRIIWEELEILYTHALICCRLEKDYIKRGFRFMDAIRTGR
ncbi:hypothetical protein L198_00433 [Cryptococcus wingfieldii CBS 7118]|uniref:Uncharacterized protein n=1 Tax=Cryptococcus wingfieldii CBS 7118 TaxID=1295528 RepID=A0A1E3K6C9_9TREE|nr:hypothetical protein L198_00433 [Cryptococcus wingfieldii CBS 7118]ODO08700.1 hypothetical protein L198_00433 [Cryptococcus wingfieldii CBS 7118]